MIEILWSPQAQLDLLAIRDYIAQDSPRYAELVVQRIISGVERLASLPESGRLVPERQDPRIREVIIRLEEPREGVQSIPLLEAEAIAPGTPIRAIVARYEPPDGMRPRFPDELSLRYPAGGAAGFIRIDGDREQRVLRVVRECVDGSSP